MMIIKSISTNSIPTKTPMTNTAIMNKARGTKIGDSMAPTIPANSKPLPLLTPSKAATTTPMRKPSSM